jgi:hypothetical protein
MRETLETHSKSASGDYCPITIYPHDAKIGTRIQPQKVNPIKAFFAKEPKFKHNK